MSNLRGRMLEDEFCDIARELDGDVEGRTLGEEYLKTTNLVPTRAVSSTWALTPKIFDTAEIDILQDAAETMARILEKVTAHYLREPEFRALFDVNPALEELTLEPCGYEQLIPLMRLDMLFNDETGDFTFTGVATDSSKGMTASVDVTRALQRSETYRRFAERHKSIETFNITDGVIATLRETYTSWANSDADTHHPEHPVVGIVDYPESATEDEFSLFIERMADEGVFARFVDIRDLRIEEAAGVYRLVDSEGPIDCVYRRVLLSEMLDKPCDGAKALVEAAHRGLACVIGGFRTWPVATNALFAVLNSEAVESVLDPFELAFVRAHVPEAHILTPESDINRYLAEQDDWLVRPAGAYNATEAVAGVDREDRDEWWRVLLACCEERGVIIKREAAYQSPVILGSLTEENTDPAKVIMANNLLGLYVFRGKFGGVHARCAYDSVMGQWGNRLDMGCLVVRD